MRAFQIGHGQNLDSLHPLDRPIPEPGPGQALVRVHAAALNHRDLMIVSGGYHNAKPADRIPLSDGVGTLVALGPDTSPPSDVQVGQRVTAAHFVSWIDGAFPGDVFDRDIGNSLNGWLADYVLLPAAALVAVPTCLEDVEVAALPAAGVTAWSVMHQFAEIRPGDIVLSLGTGGVSIMALQLARMAGAHMAITSSCDEKLTRVRAFGADITVNYRREPEWQKAILAATGGRGVDIVLETVGAATLGQSLACCAPNARIGFLGALGGRDSPPDLAGLIAKNVTLRGITSGSRTMLASLLTTYAQHRTSPVIDRVFAFSQAKSAYQYLNRGGHIGKIVIELK